LTKRNEELQRQSEINRAKTSELEKNLNEVRHALNSEKEKQFRFGKPNFEKREKDLMTQLASKTDQVQQLQNFFSLRIINGN